LSSSWKEKGFRVKEQPYPQRQSPLVMTDTLENPICIFILNPYLLNSAGLRLIIECEQGLKVVGEAQDLTIGLEMVASQKPDIILLKLNPIGDPNLEVITQLLETSSQTRIILMTTSEDKQVCSLAIQKGIVGIVAETQMPQTLIKAIRKVHAGEVWIEHALMAHFVTSLSRGQRTKRVDPDTEHISLLSNRERQVVQFISLGLKNKQIAAQLCISEVTVRHHLTSVYNKLGVSDRLELLVFAHRHGLVMEKGKN
jgi:two-component system, NarL family, nitrate/nitrite response regulator NarL